MGWLRGSKMVLLCNITSLLFALISISSLLSIVKSDEDRGAVHACLWGNSIKNHPDMSLEECIEKCSSSTDCESLDYLDTPNKWNRKWCYLQKETKATKPEDYKEPCPGDYANSVYLEKKAGSTAWFYITSELNSQVIAFRWHHANKDVVMWRKSGREAQLWRWDGNNLVTKQNGNALTIKNADKKKKATVWLMPKNGGKEQEAGQRTQWIGAQYQK